jgi:anti-sigma B factor antagonist
MAISDRSFNDSDRRQSLMGAPTQLEVQDVVAGGWHTLRLSGELDLASTSLLHDAIERIDMSAIAGTALDLRNVAFIDSTGVRAVVELHDRSRQQGIEFRIIPGSAAVQRIFEVTGLLDVLPFQADGLIPSASD